MRELFEDQLNQNTPITEDSLVKLNNKTYFNGESIKVGEVILFAMLVGDVIEKENEVNELPADLIKLNEKHFDQFTYDERLQQRHGEEFLPIIQLKKSTTTQ